MASLDRAASCFRQIQDQCKYIECALPKNGALAGEVVTHAFKILDKKLAVAAPMVYKIGFTHCPVARFFNPKFGYHHDPHQKWEKMIVVFASHEAVGPAFLEAALIQRYKGRLVNSTEGFLIFWSCCMWNLYWVPLMLQGLPIYIGLMFAVCGI